MKNLKIPTINNSDIFEEIIAIKKQPSKTVLFDAKKKVINRYNDYVDKKNKLELLSVERWSIDEIKALKSCYTIETGVCDKLKAEIRQFNNLSRCQYCGISPISPFDHYLPKKLFPEFSIFSLNLIPCCSDCNNKKGEKWDSSGISREFINFYFDPIDRVEIFLFCRIEFNGGDLFSSIFYLNFSKNFNQDFCKIITKHFLNLNLLERYAKNSNSEISSIKDSIVNTYKREESLPIYSILFNKIKIKLRDDASSKRLNMGKNNWTASLMDGLAESDEFIYYCIKKIAG